MLVAAARLSAIHRKTASTAPMPVTSKPDSEVAVMSPEQGKRELEYQVALLPARGMLQQGLITTEEYLCIETIFQEKYHSVYCGLYPGTLAIPSFQS